MLLVISDYTDNIDIKTTKDDTKIEILIGIFF